MATDRLRTLPKAILFDLDGTLADTAPDLAAAVNLLEAVHNRTTTPYALLRPFASAGARGLIGVAFGLTPQDDAYEALKDQFLANYAAAIAVKSTLFEGITALLTVLDNRNIAWGIVTNKAARLTDVLVPQINLQHAGCVVSGDTTPYAKPHPAPLLEAARRLAIAPEYCWYVGDDPRDMEAGRAAGMATIAAGWGYCGQTGPLSWSADAVFAAPAALLEHLSRCE